MEAGGSGRFSRWTGGPRPEEREELVAKSEAYQSKGGRWGGIREMKGDGDDPEKN